ncbi:hypothetical protein AQUCO_03400326v1 [Aquilegia coerulea]|uniref:Uncharacterized protein n=1 Tax=Aquilegia coerulea TaxID=218851 RepID=A0A2G5CYK8_AQUCA|nr:hypothetical protein AQUCO_03400326v1 [Aquilegia coerulea]
MWEQLQVNNWYKTLRIKSKYQTTNSIVIDITTYYPNSSFSNAFLRLNVTFKPSKHVFKIQKYLMSTDLR